MYAKARVYQESAIVPTILPDRLFSNPEYQNLLDSLAEKLGYADDVYNSLYKSTIFNLVKVVQCLPDIKYSDKLWLQVSIERATFAVDHAIELRKEDSRFIFAVFTASLFLGLGRLVTNYQISLCDKDGVHEQNFSFLDHGFLADYSFFRSRPLVGLPIDIINPSTLMLAYKIIAKSGLAWILEEPKLYSQWIHALTNSGESAGELHNVCELAENILRRKKLKDLGLPVDVYFNNDLDLAEKFWLWLRQGVKEGAISINGNSSLLHVLAGGDLFVADKLFLAYLQEKRKNYKCAQLIEDFNKLGLSRLNDKKGVFTINYKGETRSSIAGSSFFKQNTTNVSTTKLGQNEAGSLYSSIAGSQKDFIASADKKGVVVSPGQLLLPLGSQQSAVVQVSGLTNSSFSLDRLNKAHFSGINQQQF